MMRDWKSLFGCVAIGLALSGVHVAAKEPADRDVRSMAVQDHPDGLPGSLPPDLLPPVIEFGGADVCEQIGFFDLNFAFQDISRYRGNALLIDVEDVELLEFKMQLLFSGSTTLHFSVHQRCDAVDVADSNSSCFGDTVGTYARVAGRSINAVGTGNATFYSSGTLAPGGLGLSNGKTYALGVAWGNSTAVTYARNNQATPVAIDVGEVRGNVARNNITPPLADQIPALTIFTNGIYSMQLCFAPVPGACCANGSCSLTLPNDCLGEGSFFHGQRTSCETTLCRFGACCSACADDAGESVCRNGYTPEACAFEGGSHLGGGTTCRTDPAELRQTCPPVVGACCTGETCVDTCESDCIQGGGIYRGDGTSCSPVNICKGACCAPGVGCVERTSTVCQNFFAGTYRGDGTTCGTLPTELECGGACCFNEDGFNSQCVVVSSREACTQALGVPNAIYRGDGTTCTGTCPRFDNLGACCRGTSCTLTTQANCTGGTPAPTWMGAGTVCNSSNQCPEIPLGACCLPTGDCVNVTSTFCTQARGAFTALIQCKNMPVNSCPTGPCCFDDGSCGLYTAAGCAAWNGHVATACTDGACNNAAGIPRGACCADDGTCAVVRQAQCDAEGRLYQGDGTTCGANTCPGYGACCRTDGECFDDLTENACELRGTNHSYGGNESDCALSALDCDERGACCLTEGACLFVLGSECESLGGFFAGAGQFCDAATCPSGACCLDSGACAIRSRFFCNAQDGDTYQGNNSACTAVLCTPGACCNEQLGTCEDGLLASECVGTGKRFGRGSTCANLDPPCNVLGACCLPDETCERLIESQCEGLLSGTWLGPDVTCGETTCHVGACCEGELACEDDALSGACVGTFIEDGLCSTFPCEPHGACCMGTFCTNDGPRSLCVFSGGVFQGENSICPAEGCGACCTGLGVCAPAIPIRCVGGLSEFTSQAECAEVTCEVRGGCCTADGCVIRTEENCALEPDSVYLGDDVACSDSACDTGACCVFGEVEPCTELLQAICDSRHGLFKGVDSTCAAVECPDPCEVTIASSDPANCAIDAGRAVEDGETPARGPWRSIRVTFECEPGPLTADDFSIDVVPPGPTLSIANVMVNGAVIDVVLTGPVPAGHHVCVTRAADDVNGDSAVDEVDLAAIIAHLSGVPGAQRPLHSCDVNRSGVCTTTDLLEVIDILNRRSAGIDPAISLPPCPTTLLAVFDDPNSSFATSAVHDVNGDIVYFDAIAQSVVWSRTGVVYQSGFWPVNDPFVGGISFQIRFGTHNGQKRAYFTESIPATVCDFNVFGSNFSISPTTSQVPQD